MLDSVDHLPWDAEDQVCLHKEDRRCAWVVSVWVSIEQEQQGDLRAGGNDCSLFQLSTTLERITSQVEIHSFDRSGVVCDRENCCWLGRCEKRKAGVSRDTALTE